MAIKKPEETEVKDRYNKSTILQSAKYKNRRDLLDVLLDEKKYYTISEVENAIKKYMNGGRK